MWWLIVSCLVVGFITVSWFNGPQRALGIIVPISYFFPAWLILPMFSGATDSIVATGPDIKIAVGSCCLVLYCFMPGRTFPVRLVPCDFALLLLVIVHCCSDMRAEGFSIYLAVRIYAEWYLPYVAGRLAFQSRELMSQLWPILAVGSVVLALAAVPEAVFGQNIFEIIFGARPEEGANRMAERWGLKRAYGMAMHPIYFGVIQLLMFGWCLYAMVRAIHKRSHAIWLFAPLLCIAGMVVTGSRGPVLGVVICLAVTSVYLLPKTRIPIAVAACLLAIFATMFREQVVSGLESWARIGKKANSQTILIEDEYQAHSGTLGRINLLKVYSMAMKRAGLLGFGSDAVLGFPINVPVGPQHAETLKKVPYIDNVYVLLILRFGYLGVAAFALAGLLAVAQFMLVGRGYPGQSPSWLCGTLAGTTAATMTVLATVWMPLEIAFPLMWTFGVSSGLFLAHSQDKLGLVERPSLPRS